MPPIEIDVRPLLAAGKPPLPVILQAVGRLSPGQGLRLTAPFEPLPLYDLLAGRGLRPTDARQQDGIWEILFQPTGEDPGS